MTLKTMSTRAVFFSLVTIPLAAGLQAAIPSSERAALIALYESTDGDQWSKNTNWLKEPGVFNDVGTECTWFGVTCDAGEITVTALSLHFRNLTGPIPAELGNLTNLQLLVLDINQLTGPIPPELGNLVNLQTLNIGGNQLTGSIPQALGNLVGLQALDLRINQLAGPSRLNWVTWPTCSTSISTITS